MFKYLYIDKKDLMRNISLDFGFHKNLFGVCIFWKRYEQPWLRELIIMLPFFSVRVTFNCIFRKRIHFHKKIKYFHLPPIYRVQFSNSDYIIADKLLKFGLADNFFGFGIEFSCQGNVWKYLFLGASPLFLCFQKNISHNT